MTSEDALRALARYRGEIDSIDLGLLDLLNRRTRLAEEIGRIKESLELPIHEPAREIEVVRNVTAHNQGPLASEALERIFERIIYEMRKVQNSRRHGGGG